MQHFCLLLQGSQVAGARHVHAGGAAPIVDIQGGGVIGHAGAQNRDVARGSHGGLESGRGVGHDQVHAAGDKVVYDGGAGVGVAGGVLHVKGYFVAQFFLQRVLEALGGGVQRHVLHQLTDADAVGVFRQSGCAHTERQNEDKDHSGCFFHKWFPPVVFFFYQKDGPSHPEEPSQ